MEGALCPTEARRIPITESVPQTPTDQPPRKIIDKCPRFEAERFMHFLLRQKRKILKGTSEKVLL